jgi:hypothetical protein
MLIAAVDGNFQGLCQGCHSWLRATINSARWQGGSACRRRGVSCIDLWLEKLPPSWEHFCPPYEEAWTAVQFGHPKTLRGRLGK